jgi:zinc transporter 1/2/3
MLAALFSLFCIEMWLNSKTGGHDHGGATGQSLNNVRPPMMPDGNSGERGISLPKNNGIRSSSSQETLTNGGTEEKVGYKTQ